MIKILVADREEAFLKAIEQEDPDLVLMDSEIRLPRGGRGERPADRRLQEL